MGLPKRNGSEGPEVPPPLIEFMAPKLVYQDSKSLCASTPLDFPLDSVDREPAKIHLEITPPEINIDFTPSQAYFDANALDGLDRSRSRNRVRARSDYLYASQRTQRESSDRIRAKSASAVSNRDHILDLADPSILAPIPEGNESSAKSNSKRPATFQCNLCSKRFMHAYNLKSHLRGHTDERPFICSVCGKAFARQHDRKRHEGLHSGEKKFVCRGTLKNGNNWGCGRRFARADALGRHFRTEAGRVCVQLLLDEEFEEKERQYTMLLASNTPTASNGLFEKWSVASQDLEQEQQTKKRKVKTNDRMGPPPLGDQPTSSSWSLPPALLAQYPALAGVQWDQLPSMPPDQFNDSGYSGSSSFEASTFDSEDHCEDEIHGAYTWSHPPKPSGSLPSGPIHFRFARYNAVPVQASYPSPSPISYPLTTNQPYGEHSLAPPSFAGPSSGTSPFQRHVHLPGSSEAPPPPAPLTMTAMTISEYVTPDACTAGSTVFLQIRTNYDLVYSQSTLILLFGSKKCVAALQKVDHNDDCYKYLLSVEVPPFPLTNSRNPTMMIQLQIEDKSGSLRGQVDAGKFTFTNIPPNLAYQSSPDSQKMKLTPTFEGNEAHSTLPRGTHLLKNDDEESHQRAWDREEKLQASVDDLDQQSQPLKFGNLESLSHPLPSDSGYHSGRGTDTESICSLGSVGSSLGLPQNFLQEFIAFFGNLLIEKAGTRAWAAYALAHHSSDNIQQQINLLLKRYTENLSTIAPDTRLRDITKVSSTAISRVRDAEGATWSRPQPGKDSQLLDGATKLIRRYRPKIARYFFDNAVSNSVTEHSLTSRLHALSKQLSLTEKLGLLDKAAPRNDDQAEATNDIPTDEEVDELFADIEGIRDLLVSSAAFEHLAADLRRTLYCGDEQVMNRIKSTIFDGLAHLSAPKGVHTAVILVRWSLPSFMKSQYDGDGADVGSVVALSGSVLYAQATTCLEYAKTVWPSHGSDFISALEAMLGKNEANRCRLFAEYQGLRWSLSQGPDHMENDKISSFRVSAEGPIGMLVDLAQQLAWIGSALNSSPYEEQLVYCKPVLKLQSPAPERTFNLSFEHAPLHPTENACWLPMFCGASIAHGFPIPERGEETGLEIPLNLMASITGVRHAVEFEGGVVMKGFSTLFVPTKKTGNRVQWHLISSGDADVRLSYREGLRHCNSRLSTQELSLAELSQFRAIVGWCTSATSLLGTKSVNYENIDYSGAEDADTPLKFAGGTLGFQQFGVAQLDFTLGAKDGKSHFQRSGPFGRIVSAASRTPVVLFDTSERRAWLVPASDVMLHIAQHRHWLEPFEIDGKRIDFLARSSDSSSAKEILLKNAAVSLSEYEEYTFKDLVLNIWSAMEFLIDQNVVREQSTPGTSFKATLRESISGYEFKAVVQDRSPFRQKQVMIGKTSGGWPMLARDIDALVLFANGFEDLIQPRNHNTKDLCKLWRSVPKWKDYLATSISTVKDLYDVAGSRLDRRYLSSTRLQWDRGSSVVFEGCRSPGAYRCRCNRLQQIIPKSAIGTIVPPGELADDGAVIFGHSGNLIRDVISKTASRVQATDGLYSQPNLNLMPANIRLDPDDCESVTSDDEPAGRSGSDATTESFPSSVTSFASRESVTPALEDLKINPSENTCAKKRMWEWTEGGSKPTSGEKFAPKRAKYGQFLQPDVRDSVDKGEESGVRPVAELVSSAQNLRKINPSRHLRYDSGM